MNNTPTITVFVALSWCIPIAVVGRHVIERWNRSNLRRRAALVISRYDRRQP